MTYKLEVIDQNILAREQEISVYEVNITNYEHIVANAGVDLADFAAQISERLVTEKRELLKTQLVLNALRAQRATLSG